MSKFSIKEDTLNAARNGDNEAMNELIRAFAPTVERIAASYVGRCPLTHSDLIQEGMIGLFKAIRDFDNSKLASFKSFAELCVRRQIITAVKAATRKKHLPLNNYISLSKPVFDDEGDGTLEDFLSELKGADPEELFIWKENATIIGEKMNEVLSKLEREVLGMYLEGKSYQEIAKLMDRPPKSIDNALQRIKKKLEKYIT